MYPKVLVSLALWQQKLILIKNNFEFGDPLGLVCDIGL
jgi:hypothetical protein